MTVLRRDLAQIYAAGVGIAMADVLGRAAAAAAAADKATTADPGSAAA